MKRKDILEYVGDAFLITGGFGIIAIIIMALFKWSKWAGWTGVFVIMACVGVALLSTEVVEKEQDEAWMKKSVPKDLKVLYSDNVPEVFCPTCGIQFFTQVHKHCPMCGQRLSGKAEICGKKSEKQSEG